MYHLGSVFLLLLGLLHGIQGMTQVAQPHPVKNVLIIYSDDHSYHALGAMTMTTAQSVELSHGLIGQPQCDLRKHSQDHNKQDHDDNKRH